MFQDYDLVFMIWTAGIIIPLVSLITKAFFSNYEYVSSTNLSFNFGFFCLLGVCYKGVMHTCRATSD